MLRDAGVRGKLFAVLAIPMLLLVLATGWLVGGQVQTARQAGKIEAVTNVAIQLNRVVHSLQLERSDTLGFLQDPTAQHRSTLQSQRGDTDAALVVLREKVVDSPIADMSTSVQAAASRTSAGHSELVSARKSIDSGRFFATETDVFYGKIIATDLQLPGIISASASPELAQRLQAEQALSMTIEAASHERDLVQLAYLSGTVNAAQFGQASSLVAQQRQSLQDFQRAAPPALFTSLDNKLTDSDVTQLDVSRRHLTDLLNGRDPSAAGAVTWINAANPRISSMVTTEGQLVNDIATVAASIQSAEQLKAGVFGIGALFGLVLAVLLAAVLAQRITLPLRRLTLAAGEIGAELPRMVERMQRPGEGPGVIVEPIPVESDDEIGRLAAAFNTVNEVTLRVAQEQAALRASIAEMFVNVARRNQVLLGRQLAQLDTMEAREEDPDLLKSLFGLDHLATRMRRNAESLLVLAGIDSTRRLRQSMPLSDVINAALGEIEAYERIDEPSMSDDPDVSGRHALSISHLLAELLENATVFSNPDTRVVVAAAMTGHGVDVTITDYGLGMSEEEIVAANESIAHPPLTEIAVSQRLGLFVVGRIAARLGATATLRQGRSAGTVVTVSLPLAVFEGLQVVEPAAETALGESVVATVDGVDALHDEPTHDATLTGPGALVGALSPRGPAAAVEADVPPPASARFNPSAVALSRLPQVDMAALLADAEADRSNHAIAAPFTPESSGRRLLPRRGQSDVPVGPVDAPPPGDPAEPVAEHTVLDVPVADVAAVDEAPLEVADGARRRGSFFARRRPEPAEPTEQVEAFDVEQPSTPAQPSEVAVSTFDESPVEVDDVAPAVEPTTRRRGLFGRRKSSVVERVPDGVADERLSTSEFEQVLDDAEPVAEPVAEQPVEERVAEPVAEQPVAEQPVAEQPVAEQPVAEQPGAEQPLRSRGLFGRRQQAVETVVEDAVEPVAAEPVDVAEPGSDTVLEPIDVAPMLAPVDEIAVPGPFAWPAAEEPVVEAPVAVLPAATLVEQDVTVEPVDTSAEQDSGEADAAVAEHDVEAVAEPTRRRGLFGRRHRTDQPAADAAAPESAPPDSAADVFASTPPAPPAPADLPRDSFATHLPEPIAALAPAPAAPLYLASAIDILPGKPMGRRRKPEPVVPAAARVAPPAPVAPAAPAAYAAPPVPAPPVTAPPMTAGVSAPPSFAHPVEDAPVFGQAEVAPSMPLRAAQSTAPSAPPRQATPSPDVHPAASAPMTELDQMALNAELQKSALPELRGLYEPSSQAAPVADAAAGLIRRQRRAVEAVVEEEVSGAPSRSRDATQVRGMLSGFRAGVERGRSAAPTAVDTPSYGDVVVESSPPTDSSDDATQATDNSTD